MTGSRSLDVLGRRPVTSTISPWAKKTLAGMTTVQNIDDHHGGVVTVPVSITIVGTDDKPVITSPSQVAAITEIPRRDEARWKRAMSHPVV